MFLSQHMLAQRQFEMTPEVDRLIRVGLNDMYNYDLNAADKKFDELIRRFPVHPIGYTHKAMVVWWKALCDRKNKILEETFDRYIDEAIVKGQAILNKNQNDFYARLYTAAAYGNRTRFKATITRSYLAALRSGLKGHEHNKAALALRKDYIDCLIGTGAYNYFTGSLPIVIKPFAWMIGARGDKDKGIAQLELAAQKGEYGQTEAKTVLLGIYFNEKRFEDYKEMLISLIDQYPANPVYYVKLADFFIDQKKLDEGIQFFSELVKRGSNQAGLKISKEYASYEKGRLELEKKVLDKAFLSLTQVINAKPENKNLLAQAHLLRAFALDLKGQREAAKADYQTLLSLPDFEDSHGKAKRFLKTPYRGTG
jgi:tetratricopeptide (TPR) repeat protein